MKKVRFSRMNQKNHKYQTKARAIAKGRQKGGGFAKSERLPPIRNFNPGHNLPYAGFQSW